MVVVHAFVGHAVSCVYKTITHAVVWPKKTGSCHQLASVSIVCHQLPGRIHCSAASGPGYSVRLLWPE